MEELTNEEKCKIGNFYKKYLIKYKLFFLILYFLLYLYKSIKMEDFLREYIKSIVQGIKPSVDDTLKLFRDLNNFIEMDMEKCKQQRQLLDIPLKERNPRRVYSEKLKANTIVYDYVPYILSEEEEKQSNKIKLLISIVNQETYNYLKNLSNNPELLKEYYVIYIKYTNMIKSLFERVIKQIQVIYNQEDYLLFFNQDTQFIEYMKKNINMGELKDGVFTYTYNLNKETCDRFPNDYFNLLWKYFIEDKV